MSTKSCRKMLFYTKLRDLYSNRSLYISNRGICSLKKVGLQFFSYTDIYTTTVIFILPHPTNFLRIFILWFIPVVIKNTVDAHCSDYISCLTLCTHFLSALIFLYNNWQMVGFEFTSSGDIICIFLKFNLINQSYFVIKPIKFPKSLFFGYYMLWFGLFLANQLN